MGIYGKIYNILSNAFATITIKNVKGTDFPVDSSLPTSTTILEARSSNEVLNLITANKWLQVNTTTDTEGRHNCNLFHLQSPVKQAQNFYPISAYQKYNTESKDYPDDYISLVSGKEYQLNFSDKLTLSLAHFDEAGHIDKFGETLTLVMPEALNQTDLQNRFDQIDAIQNFAGYSYWDEDLEKRQEERDAMASAKTIRAHFVEVDNTLTSLGTLTKLTLKKNSKLSYDRGIADIIGDVTTIRSYDQEDDSFLANTNWNGENKNMGTIYTTLASCIGNMSLLADQDYQDADGNAIDYSYVQEDLSLVNAINAAYHRTTINDSAIKVSNSTITVLQQVLEMDTSNKAQRLIKIETDIANLIKKHTDDVNTLNTSLDSAVSLLNQSIKDESERAKGAEETLTKALSTETKRAVKAEETNANAIAAIDNDTRNGAYHNFTQIKDAIDAEVTRADAAEKQNAAAVAAEAEQARAAEQANAQAIANEASRADAAEKANKALIEDEIKTARAAEEANMASITQETNRATGVESALTSRIEALEVFKNDTVPNGYSTKSELKVVSDLVGTESVASQIDTKINALDLANTYEPIGTTNTLETNLESILGILDISNGLAEGEQSIKDEIENLQTSVEGVNNLIGEDTDGTILEESATIMALLANIKTQLASLDERISKLENPEVTE